MYTILFVDDEPNVLTSLSIIFQKNYKVLTATSGREALDIIQSTPVNVLISDQRMPEMLGHELLRQAKAINPAMMRILLTGYSDIDAIMASVNVGDVFRFINKPWRNDKLRETVALACELYDKATRLNVEHQLVRTAGHTDLFEGNDLKNTVVLVVDTNPIHLQAISDLFKNDYDMHTARSAEDAFQVMRAFPVAVIITDAVIGETDGVDFLAGVRDEYPDIIPILLSETQDAALAIRLINEGRVFRYLIKPFTRAMLKETVLAAVTKHQNYKSKPELNLARYEDGSASSTPAPSIPSVQEMLLKARAKIQSRTSY